MTKMRDATGSVLWVLVFAFGGLWMLQDTGCNPSTLAGNPNVVAVVNGDAITLDEYQRALQQAEENYQQRTGETPPPQVRESIGESVYTQLVEAKLREQEMERLGITVADSEIYDMVLGPNPDPMVVQQFGDGTGSVNRAQLQSLIDAPEMRDQWVQYEEFLRNMRRQQKLDNVLASGVRVSEQDIADEYRRTNTRMDVQYVALPFSQIADDEVEVTDRDLRNYYNEHRDEYEREKTFTFTYATLSKAPARRDSTTLLNQFRAVREQFVATEDAQNFLTNQVSEAPFVDTYYSYSEFTPEMAAKVFANATVGAVIGPFVAGDEVHLVKIRDVRPSDDVAVRARHILRRATTDEEMAAARDTLALVQRRLAQGESFEDLAAEFGEDGTSTRGGDLGWFGAGAMVPAFEEAALDAPVGQVIGPVETDFGLHLILVEERADVEVQIADLMRSLTPDVAMLNDLEEKAEDIRYYAEENDDFTAEAERAGAVVREASVQAEQSFVPGLGQSRSLVNFLEGAEAGDMSEVIELDNEFVVARLDGIEEAGFRPLDDVRDEVRRKVLTEKKRQMQVEKLQAALSANADLNAVAQAIGATVQTQPALTFSAVVIAGLGREPKFVGTAFGLDEGQTSKVVGGNNAAYVLRVTNVEAPDAATMDVAQKEQLRTQIASRRRAVLLSRWLQTVREDADIQDNRRRLSL